MHIIHKYFLHVVAKQILQYCMHTNQVLLSGFINLGVV